MAFALSAPSLSRLALAHPAIAARVERAAELAEQEFTVEPVRSAERQQLLEEQGRAKPGREVLLAPKPLDWDTPSKLDAIEAAMMAADGEIDDGFTLRRGRDWDQTGRPSFELALA